jgi:hypothetical protein
MNASIVWFASAQIIYERAMARLGAIGFGRPVAIAVNVVKSRPNCSRQSDPKRETMLIG